MIATLWKACIFLIFIFMGFGLKKVGFFKKEDAGLVSKIVINLTLPAAVINAFADFQKDSTVFFLVLMGFLCTFSSLILTYFLTWRNKKKTRTFQMFSASGYNIGCFALPIVQSFFGPAAVVPACMFDTGNAIMVTGGNYALTSTLLKTEGEKSTVKSVIKKFLTSAPFDAYMLMLFCAAINVRPPQPLFDVAAIISGANSFLAMLMVGLLLEITRDKEELKHISIVILMRLIYGGTFAAIIYFLLPLPLLTRQVLAITVFSPVSAMAPVYTEKCHADGSLTSLTNSISAFISLAVMTILALGMGI